MVQTCWGWNRPDKAQDDELEGELFGRCITGAGVRHTCSEMVCRHERLACVMLQMDPLQVSFKRVRIGGGHGMSLDWEPPALSKFWHRVQPWGVS